MIGTIIAAFFAGVFAINSIPHLAKGMTGQTHQSPLRHGDSAIVNAVWGWANAVIAIVLWSVVDTKYRWEALVAAAAGSLLLAVELARVWSRHPERNQPRAPK